MKLKYVGKSFGVDSLTNGKIYEATIEDEDYYRVIDDSGEDYLYSKKIFINFKNKKIYYYFDYRESKRCNHGTKFCAFA